MNYQDRILYQIQYFHGSIDSARLFLRAIALIWNFHPLTQKACAKYKEQYSPFENINPFYYSYQLAGKSSHCWVDERLSSYYMTASTESVRSSKKEDDNGAGNAFTALNRDVSARDFRPRRTLAATLAVHLFPNWWILLHRLANRWVLSHLPIVSSFPRSDFLWYHLKALQTKADLRSSKFSS